MSEAYYKLQEVYKKMGLNARGKPILSNKQKIAMANQVISDKTSHLLGQKAEDVVTKAVGGIQLHDNSPLDVSIKMGKQVWGIEVKALVNNSNDKITMKHSAMSRKSAWGDKNNARLATVVVDYRSSKNNPPVYFADRIGSLRIGSMTKVEGGLSSLSQMFGGKH
jgi:hypothetical protein